MGEKLKRNKDDPNLDLIEELEGQSADEMRRMRTHQRVAVRTKLVLKPANTSEALKVKVQGVTCDLSAGGCRAVFPIGVMVGDVYRLEIDLEQQDLPPIFARCVRCRMVHDHAFEAAFSFFNRIPLEESTPKQSSAAGGPLDLL